MGSDSWKFEDILTPDALPKLLRELVTRLEGDSTDGPFAALPLDFRKLEFSAELGPEGYVVKLKCKSLAPGEVYEDRSPETGKKPKGKGPGHEAAREKYRQLKKGLQEDFKALTRLAEAGTLPPSELVDSFVSRAEIMADMPGIDAGAEMKQANAAFVLDSVALRQAAAKGPASAVAEICQRLARRKSACHAQFK